MKKTLAIILTIFLYGSLYSQNLTTLSGDWIRVNAEYKDGQRVPNNHNARIFLRYHFTKKELYQVISGNTLPSGYSRTGNTVRIEPIQVFTIETYTDKALTLVEANAANPIRYFLIPTDSFQVSGIIKYKYDIVDTDTIYTSTVGIEPIYIKGEHEFMGSIITGLTQKAAFEFNFVVQKDGTIGAVTITSSSNSKLNKRLIQLVKKTSGKWIPATYKGNPVNVRLRSTIAMTRGRM